MYLNSRIKSHHHELKESDFDLFSSEKYSFRVSQVTSDAFTLSIKKKQDEHLEAFTERAHSIISFYLVALNVATLGHFSWDFQHVSPVPYFISDNSDELKSHLAFYKRAGYLYDENKMSLSSELIHRSLKIMLAISKERDDVFIGEYIKGIYSLHGNFFNINFTIESFASFYRAFEYFCTVKILKQNKLSNEKRSLESVLRNFGFEDDVLSNFGQIYNIRCSDVMHAQRGLASQASVDLIIRLKILLDALLHRYYINL
ncbi:TPA: hypothetical protein ACSP3W_001406 [Aeromonas veronii]